MKEFLKLNSVLISPLTSYCPCVLCFQRAYNHSSGLFVSNLVDKIYGQTPFSKLGHQDLGKVSFFSKAIATNWIKLFGFFLDLRQIYDVPGTQWPLYLILLPFPLNQNNQQLCTDVSCTISTGRKRMLSPQGLYNLFWKKTHKLIIKYVIFRGICIK